MQDKFKNIDKVLLDYLDGNNTLEELNHLNEWIGQGIEKSNELKQFHDIYIASSAVTPNSNFDTDIAWEDLKKKCTSQQNQNHYNFQSSYQILKVAALAIILLVSGIIAYRYLNDNKTDNVSYFEYNVPRGSRSHIYLPDGTSVWLNAQSTLKYSQSFGQHGREVILEGEAYFEVIRNVNQPFFVKASDAVVKVLGTSFNVKAYPEENFIETTVVHGKVQVSSPQINNKGQDMITLVANQKIKILKDASTEENNINTLAKTDSATKSIEEISPKPIRKIDFSPNIMAEVYTSWKDSQWIIEHETLKELAIKIERRYNVEIDFKDAELEQYIFSGKLKDESLEQVLQAISVAAPVNYTINQKAIFFYKNLKFKKINN